MKFKLKEATVTVRDETINIRELTHAERLQWIKEATEDRYRGPALLISLGVKGVSVEEAGTWPADIVTEVSNKIMALSNMNAKKEDPDKKQP